MGKKQTSYSHYSDYHYHHHHHHWEKQKKIEKSFSNLSKSKWEKKGYFKIYQPK